MNEKPRIVLVCEMKNFSRRSSVAVWLEEEETEQDGDEVGSLEKYGWW